MYWEAAQEDGLPDYDSNELYEARDREKEERESR